MLTDDYTVRLDQFQGPMDLLLYLARKAEVDIVDIPIASIADQYVARLTDLDHIDIDLAGEFLVMAATLTELKSRLISPAPVGDAESDQAGDDPRKGASKEPLDLRDELIGQLLAYKELRDAADALESRRAVWKKRFPAAKAATDRGALLEAVQRRNDTIELEDVGLFDLVEAYEQVIERVDFNLLGAHHVALDDDDTPIEVHAADLVDLLERATEPTPLRSIFAGRSRGEIVGLFVAVLELVRRRAIGCDHRKDDGEFVLTLRRDVDAAEAVGEPTSEVFAD